jgi:drug/metabolite transporter (DMT)-like permease
MATVPVPAEKNNDMKIALAFVAIYLIWGTTYLAIRVAVATIPPFLMAGTRFIIAGLITFAVLRARHVPMPKRFHWRSAIIVGAFLMVGGNGFVTWSEQQVPSGIAALVVATVPLWITLFNWLIYREGRPGKQTVAGVLLGFVGIGLLVGPGQLQGTATFDLVSLLVLLMAPVLWSLGSLYSRRANLPDSVFMSTAMEMSAGGVLLVLAGIMTGEVADLNIAEVSIQSLAAMLYLTIFGSIVALTSYVWLLKTVEPSKAATYTYVNPVIAVFLGWLVLSEPISPQMLIAVPIIIVAVVMITTRRKKQIISPAESAPSSLDMSPKSSTPAD